MKTDKELIEQARLLFFELTHSREFLLYIGDESKYHNKIKQWFDDVEATRKAG